MVETSIRSSSDPIAVYHFGQVDYQQAYDLQQRIADARVCGGPDSLLLLEHPSTYTAGRRTVDQERPQDGTPVVDTNRGGKITWHGPGQLVGYPIIGLAEPIDVVGYVRRLEQAVILVCQSLGLDPIRVPGRSGVWLAASNNKPERKISAIGVRVSRGVTLHGFALNCNCDLNKFNVIVPCGIYDAGVTSLTSELGTTVTVSQIRVKVQDAITRVLDGLPVDVHDLSGEVTSTQ